MFRLTRFVLAFSPVLAGCLPNYHNTSSLAASSIIPNPSLVTTISNLFPDQRLESIEKFARGTLPNIEIPKVSSESIKSLQLLAFAELFEIAFFTDLLSNVTSGIKGFQIKDPLNRAIMVESLIAILAVCMCSSIYT
jgi:hypothetical protein